MESRPTDTKGSCLAPFFCGKSGRSADGQRLTVRHLDHPDGPSKPAPFPFGPGATAHAAGRGVSQRPAPTSRFGADRQSCRFNATDFDVCTVPSPSRRKRLMSTTLCNANTACPPAMTSKAPCALIVIRRSRPKPWRYVSIPQRIRTSARRGARCTADGSWNSGFTNGPAGDRPLWL